uniref:BED-type domain-containing protein n=1 Tax=Fagus sylvatica TaxID=28930 RepID=A0A2N9INA8_FAGSY
MESVDAGATLVDADATTVEAGVSQLESACTQQASSTPVKPSLPPTGKKPTGRKVSPAWDHFDKVDYPDGRYVAICKYCKRELSAASKNHGTSSLLSHAAGCAKNPNRELRGQKTLSFEPKKEGEVGFDLIATTFTIEAGRKALAEMIILDELPFMFVENYGFRRFVKVLPPKFKIISSRKTIAKEIVDNASSNGGTIKFLETVTKDWNGTILEHQFLHMRCCAHILNLIVGEGLKERDSSISKVRDAVRYVKSSPNRFQIFKDYVKTLGIESKSLLCLDIATRWNSTYIMLESAVKFEKVFLRMDFEDEAYNTHFHKQQTSGGLRAPDASDFQDLYGEAKASGKIANVRDVLTKLFEYYVSVHSPNVEVESVSEKSTMITNVDMSETNPYAFMDSQYVLYLKAEQSMGYQVLSKMAQDVLAVPISTVASESAFSTGGCILDPFRSSLSPDMVQVLVCSQNWLKSSVPISICNAMDEVELLQEEYDFGKILNFLKVLLSI